MIDTDTPEFNRAAEAHMISVGSRLFNLPLPADYAKQTEEIKEKLCVASSYLVINIEHLGIAFKQTALSVTELTEFLANLKCMEIGNNPTRQERPRRKCYYETFKKPGINYR